MEKKTLINKILQWKELNCTVLLLKLALLIFLEDNMASRSHNDFLQIPEDIPGILYKLTRLNPFTSPAYWGLDREKEFLAIFNPQSE